MSAKIFLSIFLSGACAFAAQKTGLSSKNSHQALNLLARGGVAKVYSSSILAEVNDLNCSTKRAGAGAGNEHSTFCSGTAGAKKLNLSGEKAIELFGLLEKVTIAQNLPAADSIEVKKMTCRFTQGAGASCSVIK